MENLDIKRNVSLKDFCTFKIGGKAKFLFTANTNEKLKSICAFCLENGIGFKVIGNGSNLLFDDKGYHGMIVVNRSCGLKKYKTSLIVDGGYNLSEMLNKCREFGFSGLENLAGIPATVGGAIFNNCGAFETEIGSFVEWVEVFEKTNLNKVIRLHNSSCKFAYRYSIFKNKNYIILRAKLNFNLSPKETIQEKMREALLKKQATQPLYAHSAGSIFKRGEVSPGKVIEETGLKLMEVGKAQVSHKHANFIVNTGNAKAKHVKALIGLIQQKIKESHGVMLEPEIEFVDFNPTKQ